MNKDKYRHEPLQVLGLKLSEEVGEVNKEVVHWILSGELRSNIFEEIEQVQWLAHMVKKRAIEARKGAS